MTEFALARANMVDSQIRTNGVTDERILDALREIPRELFVPEVLRCAAYVDEEIPLGGGRFLLDPLVQSRMIQALAIQSEDVVLDVGCAMGYSSAILSRLALTVVALESDAALAASATENLRSLGCDNVVVMEGSLRQGYPEQAPYNVILVNGAVDSLPDGLSQQLAENGRLCVVAHSAGGVGQATLVVRSDGSVSRRVLFDAGVPVLEEFVSEEGFIF